MAKPTVTPSWASDAAAQVLEPAAGKKAIGWEAGQPPSAHHMNWLFKNIVEWIPWLRDFESTAHTWNALQQFLAGLTLQGQIVHNGGIDPSAPQFSTNQVATRTCRFAFPGNSGQGVTRLYSTAGGYLEITRNASWDGTKWKRDVSTAHSAMLMLGSYFNVAFYDKADADGWADNAWDYTTRLGYDDEVRFTNVASDDGTCSNPPATAAQLNRLCAKNTPKAWGSLYFDGTAVPDDFIVHDGFNVQSFDKAPTTNVFRVTFAQPMADTSYAVALSIYSAYKISPQIVSKATTHFEFEAFYHDGTVYDTTGAFDGTFDFVVMGKQVS